MNSWVYLSGMAAATFLALACLIAFLIYFSPLTAGLSILILFYLSLFISSSGLLFFVGFYMRRIGHRKGLSIEQANTSFRQGILLAAILVGVLILQSQKMLFWWSLVILVVVAGVIEWRVMRK